jgi:chromosomal replication initiation ATPase DnaA
MPHPHHLHSGMSDRAPALIGCSTLAIADRMHRRLTAERIAAEAHQVVACALGVGAAAVRGPRRGSLAVVEARHLTMYLMHVSVGLSMTATAAQVHRDRRAVAYAARTVELRRETEPSFDTALSALEASLTRRLLTPPPVGF